MYFSKCSVQHYNSFLALKGSKDPEFVKKFISALALRVDMCIEMCQTCPDAKYTPLTHFQNAERGLAVLFANGVKSIDIFIKPWSCGDFSLFEGLMKLHNSFGLTNALEHCPESIPPEFVARISSSFEADLKLTLASTKLTAEHKSILDKSLLAFTKLCDFDSVIETTKLVGEEVSDGDHLHEV